MFGQSIPLGFTGGVATSFNLDFVVVAGGGGMARMGRGGAGGAGGFRASIGSSLSGGGGALETAPIIETGIPYAITIGAGGATFQYTQNGGQDGNDTTFSNITSIGGGHAGASTYSNPNVKRNGSDGGSGGGAANYMGSGTVGLGTTGQGFDGGLSPFPDASGGGGGGAASVGLPPAVNQYSPGGPGGAGIQNNITGTALYYSAGAGGIGMGVGANGTGWAAVQNTGNAANYAALAAFSGVIILKYPDSYSPTFTAGVTQTTTSSAGFKISVITAGSGDTVTF